MVKSIKQKTSKKPLLSKDVGFLLPWLIGQGRIPDPAEFHDFDVRFGLLMVQKSGEPVGVDSLSYDLRGLYTYQVVGNGISETINQEFSILFNH